MRVLQYVQRVIGIAVRGLEIEYRRIRRADGLHKRRGAMQQAGRQAMDARADTAKQGWDEGETPTDQNAMRM